MELLPYIKSYLEEHGGNAGLVNYVELVRHGRVASLYDDHASLIIYADRTLTFEGGNGRDGIDNGDMELLNAAVQYALLESGHPGAIRNFSIRSTRRHDQSSLSAGVTDGDVDRLFQ